MSESKFKTLRHMETVRNFIGECIRELTYRCQYHDQSKLEYPEVDIFEKFTPKLRDVKYGSEEYKKMLLEMKPAIDHHNISNRHHPEHFENGISGMNLIDLIELVCDWKAASMRNKEGDVIKSIEINQKRFGYSDELKEILLNTAKWLIKKDTYNKADES